MDRRYTDALQGGCEHRAVPDRAASRRGESVRRRHPLQARLVCVLLLCLCWPAWHGVIDRRCAWATESIDISSLVVFGDSLSDNGNLFKQFGLSLPFSWEGRASNGPVYVEQLAQLLGVQLDDRAFSGAEASNTSPPVLPLPINLSDQVAGYIAQLDGNSAPLGMKPISKAIFRKILRASTISWRVSSEVSSKQLTR